MLHRDAKATAETLAMMGFRKEAEEGNRLRFVPVDGVTIGRNIDIVVDPSSEHGRSGAGSVHHIAFRTPNDATQLEWRAEIARHRKRNALHHNGAS